MLERIKNAYNGFMNRNLSPSIDQQWWEEFGYRPGPLTVNETNVLGLAPVQKVIKKITNTITSLPINVYRIPQSSGTPELVDNITSRILTHGDRKYLKAFIRDYVLRGRGLIYMERRADASLAQLHNLPIAQTRIDRVPTMGGFETLTYRFSPRNALGDPRIFTEAEVIDIVNLPSEQARTWSDPIKDNRKIFENALQVEAYAHYFFNQKGIQHILTTADANAERAADFIRSVSKYQRKAQEEKLSIIPMPAGADLKPLGTNPRDALLVEAQKSLRLALCDVFNIHPAIMGYETASNISAEELQRLYLSDTLMPIIEEVEMAFSSAIWPFDSRHKVQFDISQVTRASLKDTAEANSKQIQSGIKTPNEIRRTHYLPPLPGGDQLLVQEQLIPLESAAELAESKISGTNMIGPQNQDGNASSDDDSPEDESSEDRGQVGLSVTDKLSIVR